MSKTYLSLALLALLAAAPAALHADSYSYIINAGPSDGSSSYNVNASGTFNGPVDPYNSAAVDVTSITGSVNGYDFLGVVNPGATNTQTTSTYSGITFDNVIYPSSGPRTDANGLLLYLDSPAGTSLAHVYYTGVTSDNPGGYEADVYDPNDPGASTPFGLASPLAVRRFSLVRIATPPTTSAVPEPSTWALLGTGLACLAGFVTRRRLHGGLAS